MAEARPTSRIWINHALGHGRARSADRRDSAIQVSMWKLGFSSRWPGQTHSWHSAFHVTPESALALIRGLGQHRSRIVRQGRPSGMTTLKTLARPTSRIWINHALGHGRARSADRRGSAIQVSMWKLDFSSRWPGQTHSRALSLPCPPESALALSGVSVNTDPG